MNPHLPQVQARFEPQIWINDDAVSVDPEGNTAWDATTSFNQLPADYRSQLIDKMQENHEHEICVTDYDDNLRSGPNAPQWIREWSGPFAVFIRRPNELSFWQSIRNLETNAMELEEQLDHLTEQKVAITLTAIKQITQRIYPTARYLEVEHSDQDPSQLLVPADVHNDNENPVDPNGLSYSRWHEKIEDWMHNLNNNNSWIWEQYLSNNNYYIDINSLPNQQPTEG